jgi:RHS repeat-associated protein
MPDSLGSVRLVTDGAGNPVSTHDYLPFGEAIPAVWTMRGAVYGAADGVSQRFTGMERDGEAGLDFFLARYFSGAPGRFTGPDQPFNDQDENETQSWNLFSYVRNNPLSNTDPTGMFLSPGAADDEGDGTPPTGLSLTDELFLRSLNTSLQAVQQTQQIIQSAWNFVSKPRDQGCLNAATAAGSAGGLSVGVLGAATGPGVLLTEGTGFLFGGAAGWTVGMIKCSSATGSGGGGRGVRRVTNPKHNPNSASPEPNNVQELFDKSIADEKGVRWAKDTDGTIHRFSAPSNGEVHWNGSTAGPRPIRLSDIPIAIRRALG